MNLEVNPKYRQIGTIVTVSLLLIMFIVWFIQQIRATAAYTRAMNSIAEAARKGENVTVQVAHFNSNPHQLLTDGKPKSDSKS